MPMDYCAVWLHIIYMTLCFSMFVMQPLVVVIYTLYKVHERTPSAGHLSLAQSGRRDDACIFVCVDIGLGNEFWHIWMSESVDVELMFPLLGRCACTGGSAAGGASATA